MIINNPKNLISVEPLSWFEVGAHGNSFEGLVNQVKSLETKKWCLEVGLYRGGSHLVWKDIFEHVISLEVEPSHAVSTALLLDSLGKSDGSLFICGNSAMVGTFHEVLSVLDSEKLDFLYIDGDHGYSSIKNDHKYYSPLVKKGGIVAFHDANSSQVAKYLQETGIKMTLLEDGEGVAYYVKS